MTAHKRKSRTKTAAFLQKLDPRLALSAIAVLALALRLILMQFRFSVAFDEVNYLKLGASAYLEGLSQVLHTYWSPLMPALISVACFFLEDFELAARLVSITAGTVLIIPVYLLGNYTFNKEAGLIGSLFVAIFPPLVFQSTQILTEPIMMVCAGFAIYFGLRMLHRYSTVYALMAGLMTGLAYLAHPQGIGFFIVLALWIPVACVTRLFLIRPLRAVYLLMILTVAFIGTAFPYLLFLKNETGGWTLSAKAAANWQMETPNEVGADPFRSLDSTNRYVPTDRIFHQGDFLQATNGGVKPVREVQVGPFLKKFAANFTNVLSDAIPELLTTLPLLLIGVGLLGTDWRPGHGKMVFYLISFFVFFWLIVVPAFHINLRYLSPLWSICAVLVGVGVVCLRDRLSENMAVMKRARRLRVDPRSLVLFIIAIAFLALTFVPEMGRVMARSPESRDYWADPVEQKSAGRWLRENVDGPKVIMSRTHAVDIYAGNYNIAESITIPKAPLDRLLEYARYRGVDFLVLNERYLRSYPELAFLFDVSEAPAGLTLIYDRKDAAGLVTRIFGVER